MIWIYPEQLLQELQKQCKSVYILFGNNLCLMQDSRIDIINIINKLHTCDNLNIEIDINYNWNQIFSLLKTTNLFSTQKILSLQFAQDYPITYLNKNVPSLISKIHKNSILILSIHTSYQTLKHKSWIQSFDNIAIFINCNTPEHKRLETWTHYQSQRMHLILENLACQLLCYYYEGNLISLKQVLYHLSLIYPDKNINFMRVKNIIIDTSFFNLNHWIEAILTGKKQRSIRILRRLIDIDTDLKVLLYKIQYQILILIHIKHNIVHKQSLQMQSIYKKYKVYTQYHRTILLQAARKFTINQLYKTILLLTEIELQYYQDYMYLSKSKLELLIEVLFSNKENSSI